MKTSVVIPSYNPELKLVSTLESLLPQSSFIDELIIIIDNSNHSDFIKLLTDKYSASLKIKIFLQTTSGRARSRNKGAELSTGDVLIFLDDDMLADKDLIEKHIKYHLESPHVILSGNGYRKPQDATTDFDKFLINMENGWKTNTITKGEISLSNFNFTACNMSLPKNLFTTLNGFDTRFADGEDFDFAVRALQQNIKIIYDRNLLAWHNDWPSLDTFIKRQNEYRLGKQDIFKIHPEYLKEFPNMIPNPPGKIKTGITRLLKKPVSWFISPKNRFFVHLPMSIKFKCYHVAIAFNSIFTA